MNAGKTAVAIGNFDGVHKGHQKLLDVLKTRADAMGLTPVIYTFLEHPANVLKADGTVKYITDKEEKTNLFHQFGIQTVQYTNFEEVKDLSPAHFVKEILVDRLHASLVVVGENHRFGKHAVGDAETLFNLGKQYGFSVCVVSPYVENGVICSSSFIRTQIEQGHMEEAKRLLGRFYRIENKVISGKQLGRTYGFPTANMRMPLGQVTPTHGVYATTAYVDGNAYPAITNVGFTSFDKEKLERIETHIIGFEGNLYQEKLAIDFLGRMRDFVPCQSVEGLRKQLLSDKEMRMKMMEERI